ncbi:MULTISPECIES: DUF1540 domain-containing protein [Paenibacillus]|uniref:DUF1540 domain-containing protein n=1 Tax=Paenibacillus TaxID=44249 RepID=UPI00203F2F36|nr:DUF1540 domain-containing protein [Paenibacillus camelliae]MCM3633215.1 DUF1540 domain-containing protein [Paenibacillus camelliae]
MPKGVACTVSNCSFWGENNRCFADEIKIEIDAHSKINTNEEFSTELIESEHKDVAKQSAETCCLTFVAKR